MDCNCISILWSFEHSKYFNPTCHHSLFHTVTAASLPLRTTTYIQTPWPQPGAIRVRYHAPKTHRHGLAELEINQPSSVSRTTHQLPKFELIIKCICLGVGNMKLSIYAKDSFNLHFESLVFIEGWKG